MEIKVNKEIRDYQESIVFGMNLRQIIFAALAMGVSVALFFTLRDVLGAESLSMVCIFGALPFGVLGFVKYNGMPVEKFLAAWYRSEIAMPKVLIYSADNMYSIMLEMDAKTKSGRRRSSIANITR